MWVGAAVRQIWQFANAELGPASDFTSIRPLLRGMGRGRGQGPQLIERGEPMPASEPYEIYAVRYAHHHRRASENFIGGDPHDGPMPLDYFVWAIIGNGKTYVLDTGFTAPVAKKRGPSICARRVMG